MAEQKNGSFIISLDFELMWGMFDKVTNASYGENLNGVHEVVPKLLSLFTERGIHATWATVGMLMYRNAAELENALPEAAERPSYQNPMLSAYRHLEAGTATTYPHHYFAPAPVAEIINTPNQELASHTFSHYYCKEALIDSGENSEAFFAADCRAFANAVNRFGTTTSIVFPRNQWTKAALTTLAEYGFTAFRGTEAHFLYKARTDTEQQNPLVRGLRLLDHYCNLSGHHTYTLDAKRLDASGVINLPASRFLRPWSARLSFLEPLRLKRIKNSMTHAAKNGEVFHLWWHPHNFGKHQAENLRILTTLLDHFETLKATYGMESCTMKEAVTRVRESI
jgi:hypothetical protein